MVEISGRSIKIILYLLEQKHAVSAFKISNDIGFNINTLRKDIPQVENLLRENGLTLITKPKIGFKIDGSPEKIEELNNKLNALSNNLLDRKGKVWYTAEIFLSKEKIPTIEDLCELLDISRPTAVEYINEVKEWLSKKEISLYGKSGSGYQIQGKEENIRDAIVESIRNFLGFEFQIVASEFAKGLVKHNLLGIFKNTNFHTIKNFINEIQTEAKTKFTDEETLIIALALAISVRRIGNNHKVTFDSKHINDVFSNELSLLVQNSINELEKVFQLRFTESEVSYLALKFIGAKTQEVEGTRVFTATSKFKQVAEEIVQLTDRLLGLPVLKGNELVSMLARHLESTVAKIKIGVKIKNPALEYIKKEYPVAYAVAEKASTIIRERFHLEIPDEEKGYIATYIAVSLEKLKKPARKKVFIVCPMGVATSKLLYYRLINEMPEVDVVATTSFRDIEANLPDSNVDLIISTAPIPVVNTPYVVVSPFFSSEDKKLVKEILNIKKSGSHILSQGRILNGELIFLNIDLSTSSEVIKLLANALVENGYAKYSLVEAALSREKKFPTGINTEIPIAIPHVGSEFTIKKGFAIATLKNPVRFHGMGNPKKSLDVRIIIMPVLTGKEEDAKEFYNVIEKLRDKRIANKLLKSSSLKAIEKVLIK